MMNNPMYERLKLHKPTREGIANALFGNKRVTMGMPQRQANVNAMFNASVDTRAALEDGRVSYFDYPSYVLGAGVSGLGYMGQLGGLPDPKQVLGSDQDANLMMTGSDGFGAGSPYIIDFKSQYGRAQALSSAADAYKLGTPIRTMATRLDDALIASMAGAKKFFGWNIACRIALPGDEWANCRSDEQVAGLRSMLKQVAFNLRAYDQLEMALAKAPATDRSDYVDFGPTDTPSQGGNTADDLNRRAFPGSGRDGAMQSYGASRAAGGLPSWALPVAGIALLGVLAGGLYFLKK